MNLRSLRAHRKILVAFERRADIDIVNGNIDIWYCLFEQESVLDRAHTAEVGTRLIYRLGLNQPVNDCQTFSLHYRWGVSENRGSDPELLRRSISMAVMTFESVRNHILSWELGQNG